MNAIQSLLIQIAVILALARVLGLLMRGIHQPQVVGEMIAGIMLGPSLLGLIHHGAWMNALFPRPLLGNLEILSQLGVMLFMFLVGLELDPRLLREQGRAALVTGTVGIAIPFAGGVLLALGLIHYRQAVTGPVTSRLVLCVFMGAAMSITAFPVLARILTERNLHKTRSGTLALTCAAMDDVVGWCILAFVLAVAQLKGFGKEAAGNSTAIASAARTVLLAGAYVAVMLLGVARVLRRLQAHFDSRGYLSQTVLAIIFLLLIASSLATDFIGIHQIFGAFLFGAVMPKEGRFVKHLAEKVEDFTVLFLLPLFFAYTGLRTELGLLGSPGLWALCAGIVAVAVAGKFGGVTLAARFCAMNWRQSALLGVLMNTRGLMELIILNIGLSIGVLSRPLFAMMVVMALATTFMTTPLMRLLYSPRRQKEELEDAARQDAQRVAGMHVVVPVSLEATAGTLVRIGGLLLAGDPGRLYAIHLDRPDELSRGAGTMYGEADRVLDVARDSAKIAGVSINALSFVSRNIPADIADAAQRYQCSWIVMGWHKPLFIKNVLGGIIGHVMEQSPANVAVFVDKGLKEIRSILVPCIENPQDRGALMAAGRLGRVPGVTVTILHAVNSKNSHPESRANLETLIEQEIPIASGRGNFRVRFAPCESPNDLVIEETGRHDLVILGLSGEWLLDASAGQRGSQSLAQQARCSVLIAHSNPRAPVVRTEAAAPRDRVNATDM